MYIILTKKIPNLGNVGEKIKVNPGYARNFLFPKNQAVLVNRKNLIYFKDLKKRTNEKKIDLKNVISVEKYRKITELKKNIEFFVRSRKNGKIFGSVTKKNIAKNLSEEIKTKIPYQAIKIKSSLRRIGLHKIRVSFGKDFTTFVKVILIQKN